jgi:hypothetical protein
VVKAIGKLLHKIKWWTVRPFSKATFYWEDSGAAIHVMYFHDNSIYVRLVGRTGSELAIIANEDYVKDIRDWLNRMYDDGGPDANNKKIVPINKRLPLSKPPSRPT